MVGLLCCIPLSITRFLCDIEIESFTCGSGCNDGVLDIGDNGTGDNGGDENCGDSGGEDSCDVGLTVGKDVDNDKCCADDTDNDCSCCGGVVIVCVTILS